MNDNFEISVETTTLCLKLKRNREVHKKEYEEAVLAWRVLVEKKITETLEGIQSGNIPNRHLDLNPPTNHLEEYDTIISMLEITKQESVVLTQNNYRCWIEDKWDWKESWKSSNRFYSSTKKL